MATFYFVEKKTQGGKPLFEQFEHQHRWCSHKGIYQCKLTEPGNVQTSVQCYKGNLLNILVKILRLHEGVSLTDPITMEEKRTAYQYMIENSMQYYYDTLYDKRQEKIFLQETVTYTRPLAEVEAATSRLPVYTFEDLLTQDLEFYQVRCLPNCHRIEYSTVFIGYDYVGKGCVPVQIKFHESMLQPPRSELCGPNDPADSFERYSVYDPLEYNPNNEWNDVDVADIESARTTAEATSYTLTQEDRTIILNYIRQHSNVDFDDL